MAELKSLGERRRVTWLVRGFASDEAGATAVEYALMTGFIATVIVGAVAALGSRLSALFTAVSTAF
ncbi:MAG: hypothetical protein BGP06_01055 [Rhizobiales bacterium 65-9]|nr:Flp family type IVb pilin [Hyphomicrobiales bacterium]OJY37340.1 MAG: hypothetical protein BGP06_01055 [Rhizobiales bacterium 65-9]